MKNKKNHKLLLSGLVLITAIFFNVNHCHKNNASLSLKLNDVFRISTCQAEEIEDPNGEDPILHSPSIPSDDMTEEEYLELLRRQRS